MTDAERIADGMKARGFQLEGTGGGCEAFIRYSVQGGEVWNPERGEMGAGDTIASVWVTRECDPSVPDDMDEAVDVGYYAGEYADEFVMMMRFPSVREFFAATQMQADTLAYQAEKYGEG